MTFLNMLYPIKKNWIKLVIKFRLIEEEPRTRLFNQIYRRARNKEKFLCTLEKELCYKTLEQKLKDPQLEEKVGSFQKRKNNLALKFLCFWDKKKHVVKLSYEPNFKESIIPSNTKSIKMNTRLL